MIHNATQDEINETAKKVRFCLDNNNEFNKYIEQLYLKSALNIYNERNKLIGKDPISMVNQSYANFDGNDIMTKIDEFHVPILNADFDGDDGFHSNDINETIESNIMDTESVLEKYQSLLKSLKKKRIRKN